MLLNGKCALILGVANKWSLAWGIDDQVKAVFDDLGRRWGRLDVVAHCIAHADREDLGSPLTAISRDGYAAALDTSAYSLLSIAHCAAPLIETSGGGSILTLTYGAVERVASTYSVMALAKAALEAEVRYLAAELGPRRIRVNAISAGPVRTLAGSAVRGLRRLQSLVEEAAPLRRNITIEDVGNVAAFLVSDLAQSVTGNILFVDCGLHVMSLSPAAR